MPITAKIRHLASVAGIGCLAICACGYSDDPSGDTEDREIQRTVGHENRIPMQLPFPLHERWYISAIHSKSSIDINSPSGSDSVVAAANGKVVDTSACYVEIEHDRNWSTGYYHLKDIAVRKGDRVEANQKIARIAKTKAQALCTGGSWSGPHLHWSLYYKGEKRDQLFHRKVIGGWTVFDEQNEDWDTNCDRMHYTRSGERKCHKGRLKNYGMEGGTGGNPGGRDCAGANNGSPRECFPLRENEGDCDPGKGECADGLVCKESGTTDICVRSGGGGGGRWNCAGANNGSPAECFPLRENEGDCDPGKGECADGLVCKESGTTDICVKEDGSGGGSGCKGRCSSSCRCAEGEGDCDRDWHCLPGLLCPQKSASENPEGHDVCYYPGG